MRMRVARDGGWANWPAICPRGSWPLSIAPAMSNP